MRKTILIASSMLLSLASVTPGLAQEKEKDWDKDRPKIVGSGNVVTKDTKAGC